MLGESGESRLVRIAVISDVHSNLQALQTVLARIDELGCDHLWCLGDVVGYGARPVECLELVRDRADICIQGNHDALVAKGGDNTYFNPRSLAAVAHNRQLLDPDQLAWLGALPTRHLEADGTLLAHGSPDDRDRYLITAGDLESVRRTDDAGAGPGLTFFGHTHQPVIFSASGPVTAPRGCCALPSGERILVNPGSVGQPRDTDPRAAFLWWDRGDNDLHFERLEYDLEAARQEILDAGLPPRLGDRLREGR
ncbi:metallophosphoesterase [bacterium]|nr:MAG: metallophosphoesterase [bacterium]